MWYWPVFFVVAIVSGLAMATLLWLLARSEPGVRRWAIVVTASAAAIPVAIVVHNVLSAFIGGEEAISFVLALLVAPAFLMVGAIGGGLAMMRQPALGAPILLYAAGMALFALYSLFALIITTVAGGNPSYQGAVEAVVVPSAALAMLAGVFMTGRALRTRRSAGVAGARP
jgi:hypothetical protein